MAVKFGVEAFINKCGINLNLFSKIIIYKFKIKNKISYRTLLIEVSLLPIESESPLNSMKCSLVYKCSVMIQNDII